MGENPAGKSYIFNCIASQSNIAAELKYFLSFESKLGCNDQESIQSSTTTDLGYQGKLTNSQLDTTNKSQEVSPFPADDHKAHINRRAQRYSKHKTEKHKRFTKEVPPWNVQYFFLLECLTGFMVPTSPLIQMWIKTHRY